MRPLTPIVKNFLIANVLIFLLQLYLEKSGNWFLNQYCALMPLGMGFKPWQLITYMFMHGGWAHIFFNMFTLYMFGPQLEEVWGSKRFFNFYIICGIAAGVAQLFMGGNAPAVGASGAIMGVMAGFAYLFPNVAVYIMFIPIPVKVKFVIPALMAIDLFGAVNPSTGDNVAHWAHLGGALCGLLLVIWWNKTNRRNFY